MKKEIMKLIIKKITIFAIIENNVKSSGDRSQMLCYHIIFQSRIVQCIIPRLE